MTRPPLVIVIPKREQPRQLKSPLDRPDFVPVQKPNPMALAMQMLRGRLKERGGAYFLDGTPANLERIMRETNTALKGQGLPQIEVNPRWVV